MMGARELPVIVITPPPEDGPTSTVSILTTRHWGLWAKGALRKLDQTNAKGRNYLTEAADDTELVDLLPVPEPTAGQLSTNPTNTHLTEGRHRQVEAHNRHVAATPANRQNANKSHQDTNKPGHGTEEAADKQFVNVGVSAAVTESDRLIFCKGHLAVLESIKFRGEMMRAFEQECKVPWFNAVEFEDDPIPLLPPTKHIRMKALELLKDFAENPIQHTEDLLESGRQHDASLCEIWDDLLETHGEEIGGRPLFEAVVLDDWKEESCQTWERIYEEEDQEEWDDGSWTLLY
ncbi:hypothetical protein AYO21_11605 [Fonsecaea monophora]|uniref:Uncharacterized protein n=1 Tax=Fonsecaea monophora TaxID=254056 RepID=A0A177EQN9_9EURO|nr:hypothetical protein AYO21_11605 [Fonsecaea monophora]KAH0837243.1 hypothetical protein FOPE_04809 [Fonsecaea pedrosoi]OAG34258.1 hypothetical protein AYO21_11605 [Fonsecaea monophora]